MRIWSIHPEHLDARGLVALWRETLLAQHVLQGKTKGYKHHPQLHRFQQSDTPLALIATYLWAVAKEATARGYHFDARKINQPAQRLTLPVTHGQLAFEYEHLAKKLQVRDPVKLATLPPLSTIKPHPLFVVVKGEIEPWERL